MLIFFNYITFNPNLIFLHIIMQKYILFNIFHILEALRDLFPKFGQCQSLKKVLHFPKENFYYCTTITKRFFFIILPKYKFFKIKNIEYHIITVIIVLII